MRFDDEKDFPHPAQIAAWRKMTPERKWEIALQWITSLRDFQAAGLRALHPDWTERQVAAEVRRRGLYGES